MPCIPNKSKLCVTGCGELFSPEKGKACSEQLRYSRVAVVPGVAFVGSGSRVVACEIDRTEQRPFVVALQPPCIGCLIE